jgi:hypothetical protein
MCGGGRRTRGAPCRTWRSRTGGPGRGPGAAARRRGCGGCPGLRQARLGAGAARRTAGGRRGGAARWSRAASAGRARAGPEPRRVLTFRPGLRAAMPRGARPLGPASPPLSERQGSMVRLGGLHRAGGARFWCRAPRNDLFLVWAREPLAPRVALGGGSVRLQRMARGVVWPGGSRRGAYGTEEASSAHAWLGFFQAWEGGRSPSAAARAHPALDRPDHCPPARCPPSDEPWPA